jgi:ribosome-associated protein
MNVETVRISTELIQLDQLLKWIGLAETGGQARFLIDDGKIKVNGEVVRARRKKIVPGDQVMIENQIYIVQRETE